MSQSCLTCLGWRLKESGAMARHGFARCAHDKAWSFFSLFHSCSRHEEASEEIVEARKRWLPVFVQGKSK